MRAMVKKKGKRKMMDTDDASTYTYSETAGVPKKKRIIKLSRKQKQRKEQRVARGESLVERRGKKAAKDARKLELKLAAKSLW